MTMSKNSDIVERLGEYSDCIIGTLIQEAAAEITRLQGEVEGLRGARQKDEGGVWPSAEEEELGRFLYEALTRADPSPDDPDWGDLDVIERDTFIHAAAGLCSMHEARRLTEKS